MEEPVTNKTPDSDKPGPRHEQSDEQLMAQLQFLWERQRALKFPPSLLGADVNGHDLVLLDSGLAGCIHTFIKRGSLDLWRTSMLGLYYHDLLRLVWMLNRDGSRYFGYWETMAKLTLTLVMRQNYHSENP